jgi:hypothetical protein
MKDDLVLTCRFNELDGCAEIKTFDFGVLTVKCDREEFLKAVGSLPDTVNAAELQAANALIAEFLKR